MSDEVRIDARLEDTGQSVLKCRVSDALHERLSRIKQGLEERGYGEVSSADVVGALLAEVELVTDDEARDLFSGIRRYRTMSVGELLRIDRQSKASVVELEERRPGRRRRSHSGG